MKTKEQLTVPTCPDCGHVLQEGMNDDSFECGCCDTLVKVEDAIDGAAKND